MIRGVARSECFILKRRHTSRQVLLVLIVLDILPRVLDILRVIDTSKWSNVTRWFQHMHLASARACS